ncbi:MAG: GNAT family N-acetyltransferase [Provencibacterium sp.]|nr:GNAT family N-acetyltransferase [Provencibacterium sp.]
MLEPETVEKLRQLLALECNCSPEDFLKEEAVLTLPRLQEGRRIYSHQPDFFHMTTLGKNAVIMADERLHPWLREFTADKPGHWLFEFPNLRVIERELIYYGFQLSQTYHMFLPSRAPLSVPPPPAERMSLTIRWLSGEDFSPYYGDARFPNAVCQPRSADRPDKLGIIALEGEEILGMAACSADAPGWWQIGVDVCPGHRTRGLGSYLVGQLKEAILRQGILPFYGTSLSNLASWRTALCCGFYPAWVEVNSTAL